MPISGWYCKGCGNREVTLDHFARTLCGETVCPPRYANSVLALERQHYRFKKATPGVTDILACPRRTAIQRTCNYSIEPLSLNAALTGSAYDLLLTGHPAEGTLHKVELEGRIDGIDIIGQPDVLTPSKLLVEDDKHKSDWVSKSLMAGHCDEEYKLQEALYAELTEQDLGFRPSRYIIWQHWSSNGGLVGSAGECSGLEATLAAKPHGGQYTVLELLRQTQLKTWQEMPLAGETMLFSSGKSLCDYCAVKPICWTQAYGAPFK